MINVLNIRSLSRFQDNDMTKSAEYISHNIYPEQDMDKLHKLIKIRFKSYTEDIVYERFLYDEAFKKYRSNSLCNWCLILRYDKVEPFRVIMINTIGEIFCGYTSNLEGIINPPDYEYSSNEIPSTFNGYEILELPNAETKEEYDESVKKEFVWLYPEQDPFDILGLNVKTEYHKDILELKYNETEYHPINKPLTNTEVVDTVVKNDPSLDRIPESGLVTFPYYYPKHFQDYQDKPLRAINNGIIVRNDVNAPDPYVIVMEDREGSTVFVTQQEAYIYANTTDIANHKIIGSSDILKLILERIK